MAGDEYYEDNIYDALKTSIDGLEGKILFGEIMSIMANPEM